MCCNIKKYKYPYARIRSERETALGGRQAFDLVAHCRVVRNLTLVTAMYCVEKQASQPCRAID